MKKILFACALFALLSCKKEEVKPIAPDYTRITINKITVDNYPQTKPDGNAWDVVGEGTYPDLYVNITEGINVLYAIPAANRLENIKIIDLPSGWQGAGGQPLWSSSLDKQVYFNVYDFDISTVNDELVGSLGVFLPSYKNNDDARHPSELVLTHPNGTKITLYVTWSK